MSTSFQEFLEKTAREELPSDHQARMREWREAVNLLLNTMRGWLDAADPNHVLEVTGFVQLKVEQGLGEFEIEGLQIRLGSRIVRVIPVGRNVVGRVGLDEGAALPIEGRVDVTNGYSKIILYRTLANGEQWYVAKEGARAEALESSRFESILQELLS